MTLRLGLNLVALWHVESLAPEERDDFIAQLYPRAEVEADPAAEQLTIAAFGEVG